MRLLYFLLYLNFWIAAGAASLFAATRLLLDLPLHFIEIAFIFFATQLSYTLQRLYKFPSRKKIPQVSAGQKWIAAHKTAVYWTAVLSFAAVFVLTFQLSFTFLIWCVPPGILSLAYVWRIVPSKNGFKPLRNIPGIKILLIALVWACVGGFLPLVDSVYGWDTKMLLAAETFCFILAITIPFDVRDMALDPPELRTLPQVFGVKSAHAIAAVFVLLAMLFVLILVHQKIYSLEAGIATAVAYAAALPLLFFGDRKTNDAYFLGAIDGLIVLKLVLILSVGLR